MKQRYSQNFITGRLVQTVSLVATLLASMLPAGSARAAPAAASAITVDIPATEDALAIESIPTFNGGGVPYFVMSSRPNGQFDYNFIKFDLSVIPVSATVSAAQLQVHMNVVANDLSIEMGRADGAWDESTLTWNNRPAVTWSGLSQTATVIGDVNWPIKSLLESWLDGSLANNGLTLRGLNPGTGAVLASTKDGLVPPKLVVTYSVPDDNTGHPDLGDAPDSSNHHGLNNFAYPDGTLGNFPTVWQNTPAGQPAGPRHANASAGGILGDALSREEEADSGPDQDGLNNILNGNVITDSNRDRGDDGWRNRNATFADCERTNLIVRVRKMPTATLNHMFLNVWFDGNRDGDWNDHSICQPDVDSPNRPSTEWIVQDRFIDMTTIPVGGFVDLNVPTEVVLNASPGKVHWMRFSLSDARAVQSNGQADGRGPHPNSTPNTFEFGETEDYVQQATLAGQDGALQLHKQVIANSTPVEWLDTVTYTIRLRHDGGTQPMQARLRDVLPYPLVVYPTVDATGIHYITVDSATGGAAPLSAQLEVIPPSGGSPPQQVVKWQGTLLPDAEVRLTFKVRVLTLCEPNQQTQTIHNIAEARPKGGAVITDSISFVAKCLGYDENNIQFEANPLTTTLNLDDLAHVPFGGTLHNQHPQTVTIGLYQPPFSPTLRANSPTAAQPKLLKTVTLGPNASVPIDVILGMEAETSDELMLANDYSPVGALAFCLMPADDGVCPDAQHYPNLHGQFPYTLTVRPNDLGDAPDSTNHGGANMQAYPGPVQANFPTVFDPATGLPQGPRHSYPRPFHLGQSVSREAEADLGPDQDPQNNIRPAANDPDNDRFDDGTNLALWNLNNCQVSQVPVQVFISPQAVNYFQQLGTPGYLNIWVDGNRDGDWADFAQCGQQVAAEHIVIDQPINVVGLGAGVHNINVPTRLVPWATKDKPAWVRLTLSERLSNKTLTAPGGLVYGDGRGYPQPFKAGETEDYYYRPGNVDGGPDVAVYLAGQTSAGASQTADLLGKFGAKALDKLGNFEIQMFKIDYENLGSAVAHNALLEFQIPEKLRDMEIILARGSDVTMDDISFNFDKLSLTLPDVLPGHSGSLVLGWYGCITCTLVTNAAPANAPAVDYTGSVSVSVTGDTDIANNHSSATIRKQRKTPTIGAFMDYTDDSCMDRVLPGPIATNQGALQLRGSAEPNSIIAILIGLLTAGTTTSDANGNFSFNVNLPAGRHLISARYSDSAGFASALDAPEIQSPRDAASGLPTLVDPTLPFNPMSVCFVDRQGRSIAMPTLGYSFDASQAGSWLRSGETYTVSVAGDGSRNQYFKATLEDLLVSNLRDDDGDGTFTGVIAIPSALQTAQVHANAATAATSKLGLVVGNDAVESSFASTVSTASVGVISDRSTGNPLANASVAALIAQTNASGESFFTAWLATQSGQGNPQVTSADGQYGYSAGSGTYRLDVTRSGYQPYRSDAIDAGAEALNQNIALTPVIGEAATQKIYITPSGFQPAVAKVYASAVVEFINLDLVDHAATASAFDSGVLAPGASYKVKLATGNYTYADGNGSSSMAVIQVGGARQVFMPMLGR